MNIKLKCRECGADESYQGYCRNEDCRRRCYHNFRNGDECAICGKVFNQSQKEPA